MSFCLEVCADNIKSIYSAKEGGANRIELCSALCIGGITPSTALIESAVRVGLPIHVLIRPRGGDFIYSKEEIKIMARDIEQAIYLGAKGVVIGALKSNGEVDIEACKELVSVASGVNITFHRAFDLCANPQKTLEQIIEMGCNRLLTSGQKPTAYQGVKLIKELVNQADNRISIMAGCGVGSCNAADIIRHTGCKELHASAKKQVQSAMTYIQNGVSMGSNSDEYSHFVTDKEEVAEICKAVKGLF